jgi:hypothetical protein
MRESKIAIQGTIEDPQEHIWENSLEFIFLGQKSGVITTLLEGHIDKHTFIHTMAGVYPDEGTGIFEIITISQEEEFTNTDKLYSKILKLKVPPRLKDSAFPLDINKAELLRQKFELNQMPFIILAFGQNVSNKKNIIGLSFPEGLNPRAALNAIKDGVMQMQAQNN